jgi:hypothetical protein
VSNSSSTRSSLNLASFSGVSSSSISLPTASNFPELLNATALFAFESTSQLNSTSTRPPFAPGDAQDQLLSPAPQFVTVDEMLDALSIFLPSRSPPTSIAGQAIFTSFTNSIQDPSVLSSVSSSPIELTTTIANNAAEVVIHTENDSVSAELTRRVPALIHDRRPSGAAGNVTPGFQSSPSRSKQTSTPWSYKVEISRNERSPESQVSSDPLTSKYVPHRSGHDIKTAYTSSSKTGDGKTRLTQARSRG